MAVSSDVFFSRSNFIESLVEKYSISETLADSSEANGIDESNVNWLTEVELKEVAPKIPDKVLLRRIIKTMEAGKENAFQPAGKV